MQGVYSTALSAKVLPIVQQRFVKGTAQPNGKL